MNQCGVGVVLCCLSELKMLNLINNSINQSIIQSISQCGWITDDGIHMHIDV